MAAPYDNIPGIDSTDNFHPDVRLALANSAEVTARFARGYRTYAATDAPSVYQVGISNFLASTTDGWNWGNGQSFCQIVTNRSAGFDGATTQWAFPYTDDTLPLLWRQWENGAVAWGPWHTIATAASVALKANLTHTHSAADITMTELAQEDLNTIVTQGDYSQSHNADAAAGANYPTANAGLLQVRSFGAGSFVFQYYTSYQPDSRFFWRSKYNTNWSAWKTVDKTTVGLSNVDNTSDVLKPVSTAQAAEDAKLAKGMLYRALVGTSTGSIVDAIVNNIPTFTFKAYRNYRITWDFSYYATGNSDGLFYCAIYTDPVGDAAASLANLTAIDGRTKGLITSYALQSTQHSGPVTALWSPGTVDVTTQIKFRAVRVLGDDGVYIVANTNERAMYSIEDLGNATL